jgi:hypothetical protein
MDGTARASTRAKTEEWVFSTEFTVASPSQRELLTVQLKDGSHDLQVAGEYRWSFKNLDLA